MNAITMLKHQHREVEALFKQLHKARLGSARRTVFEKVADALGCTPRSRRSISIRR